MAKTRVVNLFKNAEKPKPEVEKPKPIVEKVDKDGKIIFDTQVLDGIEEMLTQKEIKKGEVPESYQVVMEMEEKLEAKSKKKKKKGRVSKVEKVDPFGDESNENTG